MKRARDEPLQDDRLKDERRVATAQPAKQVRYRDRAPLSPARRFALAIAGLTFLVTAGTVGYILIEGMSFLDALYMTVITLSTVGYGEVKRLDRAGQTFTIGLIVVGVGTAFYLLATMTELVLEGSLREHLGETAMLRKIHNQRDHVVVCGFGRFGRAVVEELHRNSVAMVVVDVDPKSETELTRMGIPHLIGDATLDEVLEEASITHASALVVATASEAANLFITLAGREKNSTMVIHARAESEQGIRRLKQGGANQVVSAFKTGGLRVAANIVRPSVIDFVELFTGGGGGELDLEEIRAEPGEPIIGKSIEAIERENRKVRIVAVKRGDDKITVIPEAATEIEAGDLLVAIGDRASLDQLAKSG